MYCNWLTQACKLYGCAVHAYVLMTNDVHLLVTPSKRDSVPRSMQALGRRYVRYVNAQYPRTGTLWEGRCRATAIDSDEYFLSCCRYIELNPVRARMVGHPGDYAWSSYHAHAHGRADELVTSHEVFGRLGTGPIEQQAGYRALFRETLADEFVQALRDATNGGWALGNEKFKERIARASHRRVDPRPKGRPRKAKADSRQADLL